MTTAPVERDYASRLKQGVQYGTCGLPEVFDELLRPKLEHREVKGVLPLDAARLPAVLAL